MTRILIIGGSDAGISAAQGAKEINPGADITMVVADRYPNFSICGLPFYISGEVKDWHALAHRTISEIESRGIRLFLDHKAKAVDSVRKRVRISDKNESMFDLAYDCLLIGTGATSARPPID